MKKESSYRNAFIGIVGTIITLVTILLCSCTKIDTSNITFTSNDSINIKIDVKPPSVVVNVTNNNRDSIVVNVAGTTVQQGNIYISVKDTTTNVFNNNFFNAVTVNNRDSIVINFSLVNQVTCPYKQCTCIISNCKLHDHKCKWNKEKDCGDKVCNKHHPKCN